MHYMRPHLGWAIARNRPHNVVESGVWRMAADSTTRVHPLPAYPPACLPALSAYIEYDVELSDYAN